MTSGNSNPYKPPEDSLHRTEAGGESAVSSDQTLKAPKNAACASWLLPVTACFVLLSRAPLSLGAIEDLAIFLGATVLNIAGLGLGIYALALSRNTSGIRKPATIGVLLSSGLLFFHISSFVQGL